MRPLATLLALAVTLVTSAACARRIPVDASPAGGVADGGSLPAHATARLDTVVLVRTRCYGRCPAYQLTIARGGRVQVTGDREVAARAVTSVPDSVLDRIAELARERGFYTLPARTSGDAALCPLRATDRPTVIVVLVQGKVRTQVEDYTGCHVDGNPPRRAPMLEELARLAREIDAAAGTGATAP